MKLIKKHIYGEVVSYELGYAPVGRPMMNVHFYLAKGVMIDTGQSHMQKEVLRIIKDAGVRMLLITHHHEDHSGNASAISKAYRIPVYGHPLTKEKMMKPYKILPYQHIVWGKNTPMEITALTAPVSSEDLTFHPVHTPGHSKDLTVYHVPSKGWLFSGDLYLGDRIKYFRSDERILDQIASIEKVLTLDFDSLFCGHNPRHGNGKEHIRSKLNYLKDLYGKIERLRKKGMGPEDIVSSLKLKEVNFVKWFCFGNVSMMNMVRSAVRDCDAEKAF